MRYPQGGYWDPRSSLCLSVSLGVVLSEDNSCNSFSRMPRPGQSQSSKGPHEAAHSSLLWASCRQCPNHRPHGGQTTTKNPTISIGSSMVDQGCRVRPHDHELNLFPTFFISGKSYPLPVATQPKALESPLPLSL